MTADASRVDTARLAIRSVRIAHRPSYAACAVRTLRLLVPVRELGAFFDYWTKVQLEWRPAYVMVIEKQARRGQQPGPVLAGPENIS